MIGRVVSVKMAKTAVVLVESRKTHPLYKKSYKSSKRYLVDDQLGVKLGDIVDVQKIRPVSKNKHWKVLKVIGRNIEEIVEEELKETAAEAMAEVMPEEKEEDPIESGADDSKVDRVKKPKGGKARGTA